MITIEHILPAYLQKVIIETIKRQCMRFREHTKQEQNLFYEPYSKTRRKYDLTAAVISGFAPDRFHHENIQVIDLSYGLNEQLGQPELITDTAVMQIYSDGALPFNNKVVKERCTLYNNNHNRLPKFLIIRFFASKEGMLRKIEAVYPDKNCQIIERKTLYEHIKLLNIDVAV